MLHCVCIVEGNPEGAGDDGGCWSEVFEEVGRYLIRGKCRTLLWDRFSSVLSGKDRIFRFRCEYMGTVNSGDTCMIHDLINKFTPGHLESRCLLLEPINNTEYLYFIITIPFQTVLEYHNSFSVILSQGVEWEYVGGRDTCAAKAVAATCSR